MKIGEFYVWLCSDGCATPDSYFTTADNGDKEIDNEVYDAMRGTIGTTPAGGRGERYEGTSSNYKLYISCEY